MGKIFFTISVLLLSFYSVEAYSAVGNIGPTGAAPGASSTLHSSQDDVDYMVASFYCDVRDLISGSFGTLLGLLVSLAGLYSYLMTRSRYGFFFFIAGVALTGLPGLFDWYFRGVVQAFGDTDLQKRKAYTADVQTLDSWCKGVTITNAVDAAPAEGEKSVDADAMQGVGLKGLNKSESQFIEYQAIDKDGNFVGAKYRLK